MTNRILKWLLLVVLTLLAGASGSFGGCVLGITNGEAADKQAGTFGKGLEGSPNTFTYAFYGIIIGGLLAGGVCVVVMLLFYRWLERKSAAKAKNNEAASPQ